jgi:hypothetical protein
MLDNYEHIKNIISFDSEDEYYFLELIQRRKYAPHIRKSNVVVTRYYITSFEELDKIYDEVKEICDSLSARAYFWINKRSFEKTGLKANLKISHSLMEGNHKSIRDSYDKAVKSHHIGEKKCIIDIDEKISEEEIDSIFNFVSKLYPKGDKKIYLMPTVNGYHLITKKFNIDAFERKYKDIEIHRDNPTILYAPI